MISSFPNKHTEYTGKHPARSLNLKILLIAALLVSLFTFSCEEKSTIIGTGLLPESDFVDIYSTDTISVRSYNIYVDSVRTTNKAYSYLGGLYDPYFGSTTADFVSQLRLTRKYSGGQPTVDSVKLFMSIGGAKGDYTVTQYLQLYEISEQLYIDSSYYSNRDPRADAWHIGSFLLPKVDKDTIKRFVVNLPDTVGKHLLRDTLRLNQEGGATDFRSFFKGIYVRVTPDTLLDPPDSFTHVPLLMALSFSQGDFYIRVYYHTPRMGNLTFDFIINSNSARYNRYNHDFSTADPVKKIKHINDGFRDTISHLQGLNGAYTRIKLPGLSQLKSLMPLSVNKAKLIFQVYFDDEIYKPSTMPSRIYLSYLTSEGVKSIVPDYFVNASFFDGTFNTSTKKYSFNLTSFTQKYLAGEIPSPEVEMYFPEGEFRNVILKANGSSTPVRFEFIYTKY